MTRLARILFILFALPTYQVTAMPMAELRAQNGTPFDENYLSAGFHLVYFGFTNCPEICPTSLFEMTAAIDILPEADRRRITPVFVTLDPARDTPEVMARYVQPLGHGFVTVSGPVDAVDRFAARQKIFAVRNVPDADGNYSVDHSSEVLLFGPGGDQLERFPYSMDYREVARRLAAHLAAAPQP